MQWFLLTDPNDEPGGILELEPVDPITGLALELHVHVVDGVTRAAWLTETGQLLSGGRAPEA